MHSFQVLQLEASNEAWKLMDSDPNIQTQLQTRPFTTSRTFPGLKETVQTRLWETHPILSSLVAAFD